MPYHQSLQLCINTLIGYLRFANKIYNGSLAANRCLNIVNDAIAGYTNAVAVSTRKLFIAKRPRIIYKSIYCLYYDRIIWVINFDKFFNRLFLVLEIVHYLPSFFLSTSIIVIALLLIIAGEESFLLSS